MSVAAAAASSDGPESTRLQDGWRSAQRAADFVLLTMESEANTTAGKSALAAARARIAALRVPPEGAIPPREERLAAAIRAALALLKAQGAEDAVTVLEGALR